ncbi:MAG: polysaccharide deacetylase family protein [Candidatus Aminicenantes bacterium]|jgi:peptidoglycan/xylan/chitin deacetylase (PgdA/CDA1 family)
MANSLPILTFHDIDDSSSAISFPPEIFQLMMREFAAEGYQTISLLQLGEYLSGSKPFPDRTLVITFDDGYESIYTEALPILDKYGMTATVFLVTGDRLGKDNLERLPALGGRKMLSWKNILELQNAGIDLGSHTLTHPDLMNLSVDIIDRELRESKKMIEKRLDRKIIAFAYPYGYHTRTVREIAKKYYSLACSGRLGLATMSSTPFALERIDMYYFRTAKMSQLLLSRLLPQYLRLRNIPRQLRSLFRRGRLL